MGFAFDSSGLCVVCDSRGCLFGGLGYCCVVFTLVWLAVWGWCVSAWLMHCLEVLFWIWFVFGWIAYNCGFLWFL